MQRTAPTAVVAVALLLSFASVTPAEVGLSDELAFLAPLTGCVWSGQFVGDDVPDCEHLVEWVPILDGHAVRSTKDVDELDFAMETLFYFDPLEACVRYVSVTNRGQLIRGVASEADGLVVLEGEQAAPDGATPYKLTYGILPDGSLEDRYYGLEGDEWVPGHLIRHVPLEERRSDDPDR